MKWNRFKKDVSRHPWLVDIIDPFGYMRHDPETSSIRSGIAPLRSFVRQQLEYIEFRPWRSIDPHTPQGNYETSRTLEHALRCDPLFGGSTTASYEVEFEIVCSVGEEHLTPFPHDEGFTLNETMIKIQMAHGDDNFGKGKLTFDFIVKRILETSVQKGKQKMSIEIFTVPPILLNALKPQEAPATSISEYELLTRRAYVNGGPMPPIMPRA